MKQKRLKIKKGDSEYEDNFLPNPRKGPFTAEDWEKSAENLVDFEEDKLKKQQKIFKDKLLSKIPRSDYYKIECALSCFSKGQRNNERVNGLKYSINNAFPDILTQNFELKGLSEQQIFSGYFQEEINALNNNPIDEFIIDSRSIIDYQKLASKMTLDYFYKVDSQVCFRGLSEKRKTQQSCDFISQYAGSNIDSYLPYFEKSLLTSYTISMRVAESFMVARHNRRRAFIEGHIDILENRIFSSFITSDAFLINQYELLVMPNSNDLFIYHEDCDVEYEYFKIIKNT